MDILIGEIVNSPLSTLFAITGLGLLFLSIVGGIQGRIEIPEGRQRFAGVSGVALILVGLILYIFPASGSGTDAPGAGPEVASSEVANPEVADEPSDTNPDPSGEAAFAAALHQDALSWEPILQDSFDWDEGRWPVGEDVDHGTLYATTTIADGKYRVQVDSIEEFAYLWLTPPVDELADMYLTVLVSRVRGDFSDVQYGLVFRLLDGGTFYRFEIAGKGEGGHYGFVGVLDSTNTRNVHQELRTDIEAATRLTVIADGSRFYLYVNQEYLGTVEDDQIDSGSTGIFVDLIGAGRQVVLDFDDFELRRKP